MPEPSQPRISWRNTQEINPHRQVCVRRTEGPSGARRWRQLQGEARDSTDPRAQLRSDREDRVGKAEDVGRPELTESLEPYCSHGERGITAGVPTRGHLPVKSRARQSRA